MDEKLWSDVRDMVQRMLSEGDVLVKTKAQGQKSTLIKVTEDFIRIKRERGNPEFEDIPKKDFIDIWEDLNKPHYALRGYKQKDLHNGQNRHSAVSFALVGMLPYIEWRKVGKAWKLFHK